MNRSHAFLALLAICTATACFDDTEGTDAGAGGRSAAGMDGTAAGVAGGGSGGRALIDNHPSGGTGGGTSTGGSGTSAGGGDGQAGAGGCPATEPTEEGNIPLPTGPTKVTLPNMDACALVAAFWQSDVRASVIVDCAPEGQPSTQMLYQTLDGGLGFGTPRTMTCADGAYCGWVQLAESFAARADGTMIATVGTDIQEALSVCELWEGDAEGNGWRRVAGTHAGGDCRHRSSAGTAGKTTVFLAPEFTDNTFPYNDFTVVRATDCQTSRANIEPFQSYDGSGYNVDPTKPDSSLAPLVEESGAVWVRNRSLLSRLPPGATVDAFGPLLEAPAEARFVGLDGDGVAWVDSGVVRIVPSAAPAFGPPIAVPGLIQDGAWYGGADETGRIAIVAAPADTTKPLVLATLRAHFASAADAQAFAPLPDAPTLAPLTEAQRAAFAWGHRSRVITAVRNGRVMVVAHTGNEIVVLGLSPTF